MASSNFLFNNELWTIINQGSPYGIIMAKVLACSLKVSEFKFQSCYYVHFQTNTLGKDMIPPVAAMGKIAPLLSFCNDGF